jgi:hypothetical protein
VIIMLKRKMIPFLTVLLLAMSSACSVIRDTLSFNTSPTPTAVRNVLATYQPRQTIPPIAVPTATLRLATLVSPTATMKLTLPPVSPPTPTPIDVSDDKFCCLHFAAGPYAEEMETFPTGTEIVYAIWDYKGLTAEDRVRRIWIRDNLIWITREGKWDWETYGAEGSVRDLSIFDYEGEGLEPAEYRLQLYLNDELQQENSFVILAP